MCEICGGISKKPICPFCKEAIRRGEQDVYTLAKQPNEPRTGKDFK